MSSLGLFPGVVQYVPSFLGLWDVEEVFVPGSGKLGTVRTHVFLTHPPPTTCGGVETDIVWNNVCFKSVTNTKKFGVLGWHSTYRVYYILVDYTILYYTILYSEVCPYSVPIMWPCYHSEVCPYSVPTLSLLCRTILYCTILQRLSWKYHNKRCHFPIVVGVPCVLVSV